MKHSHKIVIFCLLLLLGALALVYFKMLGEKNARDSAVLTYSAESVKAITSGWDQDALKKRAHPLLLDAVNKSGQTLNEYFKILQRLGKLQNGPNCKLNGPVVDAPEGFTMASALCDMQFENSPAQITLESRQDKGNPLQITSFRVDSPLFSDLQKQQEEKK